MSKSFVNREADQERFKNSLEGKCKLVLIEGEGGTGKSSLLQKFKGIAEGEGITTKLINFRDTSYSPLDILYGIADLIGKENCGHLKSMIEDFTQSNNIVVKDNRLMFGSSITINVTSELNQKDKNDQNMWYQQVTKALFDDLDKHPAKYVMLFMDTYEQCNESVAAWVNTHLLPLIGEQDKLRVVIAGQKVVKLDVEWNDFYIKSSLAGLELSYWFKYVELRKIQNINPDWLVALYKVFDGKPAAMITALEKLQQEPLSPTGTDEEKYWALLNIYLQQMDDTDRSFIKYLAVFHWFDEQIAEYVWGKLGDQNKSYFEAWGLLASLPFIISTSRGMSFHELYRNALIYHLWHDRNDQYSKISEQAADYFDSGDPFLKIEQIYHMLISEPRKGCELFQNMVVEFQDKGMYSVWHTLNQYGLEHILGKHLDNKSAALIWESSGQYLSIHGKNEEAIEHLKNSQYLYERTDDKHGLIRVLYSKAAYQTMIGQAEACTIDLKKAFSISQKSGFDLYTAHITYRIAEQTNFGGDPKKAYKEYEQSFDWFEKAGDYAMQARNLMFMAETSNAEGLEKKLLYLKALPFFEKGWEKYSQAQSNDPIFSPSTFIGGFSSKVKVKTFCLFNVAIDEGDCLQSVGDLEEGSDKTAYYERSLASYLRALPLSQQMKDLRWSARANLRTGDINVILGKVDSALEYFQRAEEQAKRVSHKLYIGWSYVGMGNIARIKNRKEEARRYYLQAQEFYLEVGAHSNIGWQIKPNLLLLDKDQ